MIPPKSLTENSEEVLFRRSRRVTRRNVGEYPGAGLRRGRNEAKPIGTQSPCGRPPLGKAESGKRNFFDHEIHTASAQCELLCEDAPTSPPGPQPKFLAAARLPIFRQALTKSLPAAATAPSVLTEP
jgi:hypothetical protein